MYEGKKTIQCIKYIENITKIKNGVFSIIANCGFAKKAKSNESIKITITLTKSLKFIFILI
tara:strand:+ start:24 stop:206 length:183 start_codon:yes stop_codon:yes gene_type:complete